MKNQEFLRFLKYWRNTLADAARVEIQVDKIIHQDKATINYSKGLVDPGQAFFLIETAEIQLNEGKGRHNKEEDEDWEYMEQTQVLIAPLPGKPFARIHQTVRRNRHILSILDTCRPK